MLDEQSFRRLKNILTTVPKLPAWSEVLDNADEDEIDQIKEMTNTFLNFISGGETGKLLGSCLSDQNKQKMFSAVSGSKRLEKINHIVCKSPPLKAWTARGIGEVKSRLDVELTTRRALSYLSGGDIIPLLRDILYPNEKDALAEKYKTALDRIGTLTNAMQPKQKSQILECMHKAGFGEDDLRDMGLQPVLSPVIERRRRSKSKPARDRTAVIRRRQKTTTEDTLALVEIENKQNMELAIVKNILSPPSRDDDVSPSSSSDEEQDEMKNPLFPSL